MRIAVLGAGYAGVTVARRLDAALPPEVELVVVDERPTHLVQHELHRLVRHPDLEDVVQVPLADLFDRAEVRTARVESIDRDARTVRLSDGTRASGGDDGAADRGVGRDLHYDYAAVCLGAETAFYDLPGLEAHAIPLKRPADARAIRDSFLETCRVGGTAVVGGAGLSGVQVAGELAALADEEGSDADVVLLEQFDAVAPSFPENFQRAVHDELVAQGVDVRTGVTVERATADTVETDVGDVGYDTLVWTGGIRGPDATGGDRPLVRGDLRLDAHTFVVGDAARIVDADGEAVPASAAAAIREARVVADNLLALVRHDREADPDDFRPRLRQYRFDVPGWIVSVGEGTVAQVGPTVLRGGAARAMKATVGAGHLSSVGAIRQAAELVEAELGGGVRLADVADAETALEGIDAAPDPADVVDGIDAVDVPRGDVGDIGDVGDDGASGESSGPIEIEIPIDDEPDDTDDRSDGSSGDGRGGADAAEATDESDGDDGLGDER
jgi:NADH dehydrogenase